MTTKNLTYLLLTTAIVTALDASNPSPIGATWKPDNDVDIGEAEALVGLKIAEVTSDKATHLTVIQRQDGRKVDPPLSGTVDAFRQEDGTFKNKAGIRVNEDGSEFTDPNQPLIDFLAAPAEAVIASIKEASAEQRKILPQLLALEGERKPKPRSTVIDALNAAINEG